MSNTLRAMLALMTAIEKRDAEAQARRRMIMRACLVLIVALTTWLYVNMARAADYTGLRADYTEQLAKAETFDNPINYTIIIRRSTAYGSTIATYQNCVSLGEYSSADSSLPAGYAYWTCESWTSAQDQGVRRYTRLRYGQIVLTDGETYVDCALVESGWNYQKLYGFKSYHCY